MISNEIKSKAFAMYYQQKIQWLDIAGDLVVTNFQGISYDPMQDRKERLVQTMWNGIKKQLPIKEVKLILRTIDQLTDEECIEAGKMFFPEDSEYSYYQFLIDGRLYVKQFSELNSLMNSTNCVRLYQYLLSIGIDLPNYYLDGKTLIESGLAIRKEESNG